MSGNSIERLTAQFGPEITPQEHEPISHLSTSVITEKIDQLLDQFGVDLDGTQNSINRPQGVAFWNFRRIKDSLTGLDDSKLSMAQLVDSTNTMAFYNYPELALPDVNPYVVISRANLGLNHSIGETWHICRGSHDTEYAFHHHINYTYPLTKFTLMMKYVPVAFMNNGEIVHTFQFDSVGASGRNLPHGNYKAIPIDNSDLLEAGIRGMFTLDELLKYMVIDPIFVGDPLKYWYPQKTYLDLSEEPNQHLGNQPRYS